MSDDRILRLMLQWFRIHAARIAAVTLAWTAVVSGSTVVPHDDDSHDRYAAIVVEHDASAHRVEAASGSADAHPLHCLVCHWARSFRPHAESRVVASAAANPGARLPLQRFTVSSAAPTSQPPLRAPPATLS